METLAMTDIKTLRKDFPALQREVNEKPLIYFDNGATAQKPQKVIQRITDYYSNENANIHRGVHTLSQEATTAYEEARKIAAKYLSVTNENEIIFTTGTTGGINLVASSYGQLIQKGQKVIITEMEHHSNIVPWQIMAEKQGFELAYIPLLDDGTLDLEKYYSLLDESVGFVSLTHVSNSLGTINPVKKIIEAAHKVDAKVLIDGAQSTPHGPVDVKELNADFYTFSLHKVFGPTGVGILYGKEALLDRMPPYQGGGDMIKEVRMEKTIYNDLPHKFEAGTPNIAGGIGAGAALEYAMQLDWKALHQHENELLKYLTKTIKAIPGSVIYGNAPEKISTVSFLVEGTHPYDVGVLLDKLGIAVRTGHHCTQPVMQRFGIPGTIRASLVFYNTQEEIDTFAAGLDRVINMLK